MTVYIKWLKNNERKNGWGSNNSLFHQEKKENTQYNNKISPSDANTAVKYGH